jgi:hypothetical protein
MVDRATLRAGLALVITVALCAGCGSSGPPKVSPATYVSSVCSAISPLARDVATRSSALTKPSPNAVEAKQTLLGFLNAVGQDADHALSKIKSSGIPDIANGKAVSNTIVKAFTELRDAMRSASTQAQSLPTNSAASFKAGASALGARVRGSLNNIDSSGLRNAELEKAAAKEPACKTLAAAGGA